eukprot:873362-Alexandrium_andersonii.AAC.1
MRPARRLLGLRLGLRRASRRRGTCTWRGARVGGGVREDARLGLLDGDTPHDILLLPRCSASLVA